LAAVPEGWSFVKAAAAPLAFNTAWQALTAQGEPTDKHVVAVSGATGGVGLAAVQLARGLGAKVVALSRSAEKTRRLHSLGVEHVFSPDDAELKRKVQKSVGRGVDVFVDTVGGPLLTTAVHLVAPRGSISVLGVLGGIEGTVPIPSLMFKQASIRGILVSGCTPDEARAQWSRVVDVLARSGQRPQVDSTFPLSDYTAAFARLAEHPFGKVAIEMS
jgi:NADPH2:quinone reductase